MSLYKRGISAGDTVAHPFVANMHNRLVLVTDGFTNIRGGEKRFYKRGIDPNALVIGAQTTGPLGTLADGVVGLLLDVAHVLLIFAGMYYLWQGLR